MPFLKFTRDKRGYENFYLMQPAARGKSRPRLLYWFHTPPNVRVGRTAFDPEVRRTLEAQNPDVAFDWTAIVETPIPPADTERWRERRRVERAMRAASSDEAVDEGAESEVPAEPARRVEPVIARPIVEAMPDPFPELSVVPAEPESNTTGNLATTSNVSSPAPDSAAGAPAHRRKRRRRGRRKPQQGPAPGLQVPGSEVPAEDATPASDPAANGAEAPEQEREP